MVWRIHTDPYAQGWRGSTRTNETHEATVQTRFHEMIEYAVIDNGVDSIANPFGPANPLTRIWSRDLRSRRGQSEASGVGREG
jgi:hypothetical protein